MTESTYAELTFTDSRQTASLKVTKKDSETEEVLAGAEYTLYNTDAIYDYKGNVLVAANTAIQTKTTDSTGIVRFTDLPLVNYSVEETAAPEGYYSTAGILTADLTYQNNDGDIPASISESLTFYNKESEIVIYKADAESGKYIGGNIMQLYDSEGNLIDEWTTTAAETSAEAGHHIKGLIIGEIYTIVEKQAAENYLKASSLSFNVVDLSDNSGLTYQEVTTIYDEHATGQITVTKTGEVLTNTTTSSSTDSDGDTLVSTSFVYNNNGLEGATFEIYAEEDITHPDGVSDDYYKAGDLVATLTTGEDGTATTEELPLGKYYVIETTAPEGYTVSSEKKSVELTYADQLTPVVFTSTSINNESETVVVNATKKDTDTDATLSGAIFGLYAAQDICDYQGNVLISEGMLIESVKTGADGTATFSADLPLSTYTLKEISAPDGYYSTTTEYTIDATYVDQDTPVLTFNYTFKNKETYIKVYKTDGSTGTQVAGAKLTITDSNGQTVEEWTTEYNTPHEVYGLTVGETYTLTERLANDGYTKATSIEFVVEDYPDGDIQEVQTVTISNNQVTGSLTVKKTGEALTSISKSSDGEITFNYETTNLKGATFIVIAKEIIYSADGSGDVIYKAGDTVATLVTGDDGTASVTDLPLGTYRVYESEAPEGYLDNVDFDLSTYLTDTTENYKDVTLGYVDQYTSIVSKTATFNNEREKVSVDANKVDEETSTPLAGAQFTIYANEDIYSYSGTLLVSAGTKIQTITTDDDGYAEFTADLPLSTYTIKETAAPTGYYCTTQEYTLDATYVDARTPVITASYDFSNVISRVKLYKADAETEELIGGCVLAVYDSDDQLVEQ